MKRMMIVGLIIMGFVACNDNGNADQGMQPSDTSTHSETGSGTLDSTNVKPGAGSGSGSGIQASQDTGSGAKPQ